MASRCLRILLCGSIVVISRGQTTKSPTVEPTVEPTTDPTLRPTYAPLSCLSSNESYPIDHCTGFCGQTQQETVFIGVEEPVCPNEVSSSYHGTLDFISTTMDHDDEDKEHQCISQQMGCGIPWLCQLLSDEGTPCSTAELLFNIHELQCSPSYDGHLYATTKQYTQFKLQSYCCNTTECHLASSGADVDCHFSEVYKEYSNDLYRCLYSESAVNNKYQQHTQCEDDSTSSVDDYDEYQEACEYLISRTYSRQGCQCKSSYLVGHSHPEYKTLIGEWNAGELETDLAYLRQYGCASDISCVANDELDDLFVGGLLNIEQVLYTLSSEVYLPYGLISGSLVETIENAIDHDHEKIYVTLSSKDGADETAQGRWVDVTVIYLQRDGRDDLLEEWATTEDWFGEGSLVSNVVPSNVNETLQYYGSDRYYPRVHRDEEASFIGAIVFAVAVSVMLIALLLCCMKDQLCRK
mmetsp:Transcript_3926/g.6601  ORF Transcript_3926/g.6601 Transcript_3926/m.6601 type:complete len:466 (-) Transcript_3926:256-1653(-)|eukprot:CAMPEP_0197035612 /NCGR_PEP_ID=MMETSP1384-20130603/13361_1 /TAXON_ID=29189 /ORGANISM="Ammonia sp." /LENGTH=465 /DNA_ID=CAMNT_0042465697 /DNA_START=1086 /DNA_END=2483 /DNA_ORIENTATION=-